MTTTPATPGRGPTACTHDSSRGLLPDLKGTPARDTQQAES